MLILTWLFWLAMLLVYIGVFFKAIKEENVFAAFIMALCSVYAVYQILGAL